LLIYLTEGLAFGLPAAAQPGPFQAYLLAQTMRNGWRRTLPAALAPLLSDGPIILLVLLILTRLPDFALRGIQLAGGVFILYLAWRAFQTWRTADFTLAEPEPAGAQQSILEAALMNFLNPNPFLFWGLVGGPLLLESWRTNPLYALVFLLGFYGTLIGGFVLFIYLFGTARRLGPRVSKALTLVSALALFVFGIYQVVQGILGTPFG
jgi:threonine/homoserine/homoserine lactone efflux protein